MNVAHLSSVYSLINNLGSIITRYLFSPLNEIAFNHFSRGEKEESINALATFIKALLTFSILVGSFGYNYSETFLTFLYGSKWVTDEAVAALRTYMVLVSFLGLNGVIEAFFFAIGKTSINKYNFLSIFTTALYLGSTMLFLRLGYGTAGLYFGNIINMFSRIILCWYLEIRLHISAGKLLREVRPSLFFAFTSLGIFIISHKRYGYTLDLFSNSLLTMALGGILFGVNLLPIIFENREVLIKTIKSKILKKKS
jgi:O-antigen/teichoic acid export membrane protein